MRKESGEGAPSADGASLDHRQPTTVSCRRAPAELPGLPGLPGRGNRRCRFLISWGTQNKEQTRNPGRPESCSLCMCTGVVPGDPPIWEWGYVTQLPAALSLQVLERCFFLLPFSLPYLAFILCPHLLPSISPEPAGFESQIPPGLKPLKGKMGGARSLGGAQSLAAPGTERTNSKFSAGWRAGALGPD